MKKIKSVKFTECGSQTFIKWLDRQHKITQKSVIDRHKKRALEEFKIALENFDYPEYRIGYRQEFSALPLDITAEYGEEKQYYSRAAIAESRKISETNDGK